MDEWMRTCVHESKDALAGWMDWMDGIFTIPACYEGIWIFFLFKGGLSGRLVCCGYGYGLHAID